MQAQSRIALAALLPALLNPSTSAADEPAWAATIDAGVIAALSDGDYVARTYADGRLPSADAGFKDALTVLKRDAAGWQRQSIEVSNSVTAAPEVLQLSRDGRTAFVTERLGPRPPGATQARELPPGQRLFAVALGADAPRIVDSVTLETSPEALAVSPDGRTVAVIANTPQASVLQLVAFDGQRFGAVERIALDTLGLRGNGAGARGGLTASNVQWHPRGDALAINLNTTNQVAFLRVVRNGARLAVRPWGAPLTVGADPFVGRFTPDGHHYLSADWGRNFAATTLDERLPTKPSAVSVIRLAGSDGEHARHQRVDSVPTDRSSEGLAVSGDGRLVATVNMRGTALDRASPCFDRQATVTLLAFDAASSRLRKLADYPLDGVLPEGGVFDASGRHFLATVFEYRDGQPAGGGIEVFEVRSAEGDPALHHLGRLAMPHGVHHVDVAR
jgi:hypothetical protein